MSDSGYKRLCRPMAAMVCSAPDSCPHDPCPKTLVSGQSPKRPPCTPIPVPKHPSVKFRVLDTFLEH